MSSGPASAQGQAAWAAALLDPARPMPLGLQTWNGSDPRQRLAVHRNTVIGSLVAAVADTFPVVQRLVGPEFFQAMAMVFVRQSPPCSPVLAHYGRDLPHFIAGFGPAQCLPWLADVARLELARVSAWQAADADPVEPTALRPVLDLVAAGSDLLAELRLTLHPSVTTVTSAHAVLSLWAAHQVHRDAEITPVDMDRPESAWVLRSGLDVLVLPTQPGLVAFVEALREQRPLGVAAAEALSAEADFDLGAGLSQLLAHGALTALQAPGLGHTVTEGCPEAG